jgi:hypothetical protein
MVRSVTIEEARTESGIGSALRDRSYNVFQRRQEPDLLCAVPEDRPVPSFIQGEGWTFGGTLHAATPTSTGFKEHAARSGCDWLGFYVFFNAGS